MDSLFKTLPGSLLCVLFVCLTASSEVVSLPYITLFKVRRDGRERKVANFPVAEVHFKRVQDLKLECAAGYPVKWSYVGAHENPVVDQNILKMSTAPDVDIFEATVMLRNVTRGYAGKYICSSSKSPDIQSHFNLTIGGKRSRRMKRVKASRPKKMGKQQVIVLPPSADKACDPPCGDRAKCVMAGGYGVCQCIRPFKGDGYNCDDGHRNCKTDSDCAEDKFCFTDSTCWDPCIEKSRRAGLHCGTHAVCKAVRHSPTCACPEGTDGDPLKECVRSEQGDDPRKSVKSEPLMQSENCSSHYQCPDELSCYTDGKCRDPCTNSRHGLRCGANSVCRVVEHRPICACETGYSGSPERGCF